MDKRQYRFLRKCCDPKDDTVYSLSDSLVVHFRGLGYVERLDNDQLVVTESGRAAMSEYRFVRFKVNASLVLSVIAVIVSLLAWLIPR